MDTVTRRKFLQMTSGAVAVGAAAPLLSVDQIAQDLQSIDHCLLIHRYLSLLLCTAEMMD